MNTEINTLEVMLKETQKSLDEMIKILDKKDLKFFEEWKDDRTFNLKDIMSENILLAEEIQKLTEFCEALKYSIKILKLYDKTKSLLKEFLKEGFYENA